MVEVLITVGYVVACVLLFALAILVHEFGHFIVALKLGLNVEAFSIGFGPAIWKKKVGGVEYRLSWIPLGGYVSIPDVDPEGTKALEGAKEKVEKKGGGGERTDSKSSVQPATCNLQPAKAKIPAWKELLVAVAGPMMNVVLAVVLAVILACIPSARFGEIPAILGGTLPGGAAEKAGLKEGDRIVKVGGHPIETWSEMQTEVQICGGKETAFEILRDGLLQTIQIVPEKNETTGAYLIMAYSTTNHAGAVAWMPNRNPLKQLAWDAGSIFRVLKGLITPKEAKATAGALGGPVMIAEGIYRSMRRSPWDGLGFLRFLNVNLAVLNLLPIPVLDGGLILFAFLALVFRRRVPDIIVKWLSMGFMYVLIALMGILILKDSWRSWKIHSAKVEQVEGVEKVERVRDGK